MNATDPDATDVWFKGQQWARPSVAHLRSLMRRVVERPAEAAARGRAARQLVARRFSPAVLAARVRGEVARIQAALQAAGAPSRRDPSAGARRRAAVPRPAAGAVATGAAGSGPAPAAAAMAPAALLPLRAGGGDAPSVVEAQLQGLAAQASAAGFTHGGGSLGFGVDTVRLTLAELLARADLDQRRRSGPSLRGVPIARSGGAGGALVPARGERAAAGAMVRLGGGGGGEGGRGGRGSAFGAGGAQKAPIGFAPAPGGPAGSAGPGEEAGEEEVEEAEDAEWDAEGEGADGAIVLHPA
jgi:hypothetical protein